jgi:hypothetical protein
MKSTTHSQNRFRSVGCVLLSALVVTVSGVGFARADDDYWPGRFDLRIPGIVDLGVQWGEPQPINAPYVIQTRGPVHEAFAEPILYDPEPGFLIGYRPPEPLDEVPPPIYPVSSGQVTWIPGYWAWDDDRDNFLWVSGIWRNIPPGRQFVPGYWLELTTGFQWVSGFWISDAAEFVQYLPQPPESLERGPTSDPPEPGAVWVPGTWLWHDVGYLWRPGYWTRYQEGWVWTPDHYVWAPSGYIFVNGYWDYSLTRRGLLFAPIYVTTAAVEAPRFVYRPSVVVNIGVLISDLFARPRYTHYYFGDYYERDYFRAGIYPAYAFYDSDFGYDPIFATYVATQRVPRSEVLERFRGEYRYLRDNPRVRPPRTFRGFQELASRRDVDPRLARRASLIQPLRQLTERPESDLPFRFERLEPDRLNRYRDTIAQTRQYRQERERLERQNLREAPSGQARAPAITTPTPGISRDRQMDVSRQRTEVPTPGRVERTVPDRDRLAAPAEAPPRVTRPPTDRPAAPTGRTPERVTPPAQPGAPSIQRDQTRTERAPAQPQDSIVTPPPEPSAPPSIRREQLPEETQRQLRPGAAPQAERRTVPATPRDEARPARRGQPSQPGAARRGEDASAMPGQRAQPTARTATQPAVRGSDSGRTPPGQSRSPTIERRRQDDPLRLRLNRSPLGGRSATTQPEADASSADRTGRQRMAAPPTPRGAESNRQAGPDRPRERRAPQED